MVAVQINETTRLTADYDGVADVLYVMINPPEPIEGDGLADGVELDYSRKNGELCGVTVVGYSLYGWANKTEKLARIVGEHLAIQPAVVSSQIAEAITAPAH